jgi:hypothetical protein
MNNTDPTKQNVSSCMKMADHMFTNNWTFEELHKQLEDVIDNLKFTI